MKPILTVLPGITHQGTLMFRNEEEILAGAADPRARYLRFVMPLKLKIYQDHLVQPLHRGCEDHPGHIVPHPVAQFLSGHRSGRDRRGQPDGLFTGSASGPEPSR